MRSFDLKRDAKAEVKCTEIFILAAVGIDTVIEEDRADRKGVAQPHTEGVTHVADTQFRVTAKIAGVGEDGPLQSASDRKGQLGIEHGEELATERMSLVVLRSQIPLGETAHGRRTAIEESDIDRDAFIHGLDQPGPRTESELHFSNRPVIRKAADASRKCTLAIDSPHINRC